MKIKHIALTFENCEYCTIPMQYIQFFSIGGISEYLCSNVLGDVVQGLSANELTISFKKSFLEYEGVTQLGKTLIKDRIKKYPDISHVEIHYEDETMQVYSIKWQEGVDQESQYDNKGQTCTDDGLVVVVKS